MYLYVEMFDGWSAYHESEFGCSIPSGCRRIVRLKLTPEQAEQINPHYCGKSGGKEMFESVNPICIQEA